MVLAKVTEISCMRCNKHFWVENPVMEINIVCPLCGDDSWIKLERNLEIYEKINERVPYEEIRKLWNDICKSYPKVTAITDRRKMSLKCRWEQLGDLKVFEEVFRKLEASSFCKGKNDRGWRASFDWIIANQTNIVKVLEGKYDDYNKGSFNKVRDLSYLVE